MPELPEVETIKRSLAVNQGASMIRVELIREDIIRKREFEPEAVHGALIQKVARRGKYLIISMAGGHHHILIHLGMSGRFYMLNEEEELQEKHVHLILHLNNGKKLVFQDPRRFGGVWLVSSPEDITGKLGKEPLQRDFSSAYLHSITQGRRTAIKNLILDQNLIAGIGNIYADEALFLAHIRPDRAAASLSQQESLRLSRAIKRVLRQGIENRGTTFRDYRDGNNARGGFQEHLQAYGREGEPCLVCGSLIVRQKIGGRSSHYCQLCQK
ncbi:MAG: bifunctional DNA-formamidopyrimidine glycosylase/DNA-(apurinic or apyrimidinic site) lyase [Syntrophomonadaceae bacterium]|jgi:formamidopyrimidine-DNA glycosylase|nr:bifunctional DNA-formamidopyrimidine glycosylase/DNA-(apurinic or apyrimidinic site) lyase [Syntrophomonadaceae bacterium]